MCLLLVTKAHPEYKLILISNRDEFYSRKTQMTCWNHDNNILCPYDMSLKVKNKDFGTWIGINRTGNISVVLNLNPEANLNATDSLSYKSRGLLSLMYLKNSLNTSSFEDWNNYQNFKMKYPDIENTGPFTFFYGNCSGEEYRVINSKHELIDPFENEEYFAVSNDVLHFDHDDEWNKVSYSRYLLKCLIENSTGLTHQQFIKKCFELSSNGINNNDTIAGELIMKKNIFVSPRWIQYTGNTNSQSFNDNYYGTRSQIVILVDNNNHVVFEERIIYDLNNCTQQHNPKDYKHILHYEFDI